jgi:aminocarboxymuconate-semialdehyde decarboxylase
VGNPLETAVAISKLITAACSSAARPPHLLAHGGGAFPITLGRLDHGWSVRPEGPRRFLKPPAEYALLYFDSLTHSAANLRFLVAASVPSGSRWAATTRSTWGARIRCPPSARPGFDPGARS